MQCSISILLCLMNLFNNDVTSADRADLHEASSEPSGHPHKKAEFAGVHDWHPVQALVTS